MNERVSPWLKQIELDKNNADKGSRFLGIFIDYIVYFLLMIIPGVFFGTYIGTMSKDGDSDKNFLIAIGLFYITGFLTMFLYLTLMEFFKGQTLGKMVAKTKVVRVDGNRLTFGNAFVRTLCRMIPFDALSIFFSSYNVMWHDAISNTRVVNTQSLSTSE